ncbi:MAG: hypothetical protein AAFY65_01025 [Pseudomonadota bacterium]
MSNSESFIDEVSEEVRKERLFTLFKTWGWIPILAVILIVGGASWNEWQKASRQAEAAAFGDAIIAALGGEDIAARRTALEAITPADGAQQALLSMLVATTITADDTADPAAARDALLAIADAPDLPQKYRDLALYKVLAGGGTGDAAMDAARLDQLATPGAPFRPLAIELQALRALEAGDEATAVTLLRILTEEAEVSEALRRRASQLMVALGVSPDPA